MLVAFSWQSSMEATAIRVACNESIVLSLFGPRREANRLGAIKDSQVLN